MPKKIDLEAYKAIIINMYESGLSANDVARNIRPLDTELEKISDTSIIRALREWNVEIRDRRIASMEGVKRKFLKY